MKLTFTATDGAKRTIDFRLSGYSYNRKKEAARNLAHNVAEMISETRLSSVQLATIHDIMETIGARFGLLNEFRNNGIC